MTKGPNVNLCPSIAEFPGYYNIPDLEGIDIPVLRSADNVQVMEFPERWAVYEAAKKWFAEAVPAPPRKRPVGPDEEATFVPRFEGDDRTLDVDDADFNRVNLALLRGIQREFLGRYPQWRVVLCGENAASGIVIYPTVIRFGNHPIDVDPDEALRELVPRAESLRQTRLQPRRDQFAYIEQIIPNAVRAIEGRRFLVAGILDSFRGDYTRLTICLLIRGSDSHSLDWETPPEGGERFWSRLSHCGLNAMGDIISEGLIPDNASFSVILWMLPADYRGPLMLKDQADGASYSYELKSESITLTRPAD